MRIKLREKVNLLLCGFKQEWRQTEYKCAVYDIMGTPSVDMQLLNAERKISAVSQHFIANTRKMIYARQTRKNSSVRNVFLFFSSSLCSNRLATFKPLKISPLNAELNSICYLLALLGAHHFLHLSRIRVKSLILRLLLSYIYMEHLFLVFLDHTQRRTTVGRTPLDE